MEKTYIGEIRRINFLFSEMESLYHLADLRLGISDSASLVLYALYDAGGQCPLADIYKNSGISKQTINSAIKTLKARGFATLEFAEGSRKNKVVCLTKEGRQFAERYALPALKAEQRAFCALEPCEQREIMRLIGKFSQVLDEECETFKQQVAAASQTQDQCEGESCDC